MIPQRRQYLNMSVSKMMQKVLLSTVLLVTTALASGVVLAEACSYREALMALEQGNTIRGMALMRMAGHDGDRRANDYLTRHKLMAGVPDFLQLSSGLKVKAQPDQISLNDIQ